MSEYERLIESALDRRRKVLQERVKYSVNPAALQDYLAKNVRAISVPEGRSVKKGKKATLLQAVEKAIPSSDPRKTLGTDTWLRYQEMIRDPRLKDYSPTEILSAAGSIELGRRREAIHRYIQKQHTGTFSTFVHKPYVPIPGQEEWEAKHPPKIPHMRAEWSAAVGGATGGAMELALRGAGKVFPKVARAAGKRFLPYVIGEAALTAPIAFRVYEEVEPRVEEYIKKTSIGKEHPAVATVGGIAAASIASMGVPAKAIFGGGLSKDTIKWLKGVSDKLLKKEAVEREVAASPTAKKLLEYGEASKEVTKAAEKAGEAVKKEKDVLLERLLGTLETKVKRAKENVIPLPGPVHRRRVLLPEELESIWRGVHPGEIPPGEGVIRYTPEELRAAKESLVPKRIGGLPAPVGKESRIPVPVAIPRPGEIFTPSERVLGATKGLKVPGKAIPLQGPANIVKYTFKDIVSKEGVDRVLDEVAKGVSKEEAVNLVGAMEEGIKRHFPLKPTREPKIGPRLKDSLKKLGLSDSDIKNMSYEKALAFKAAAKAPKVEEKELKTIKPFIIKERSKIDLSEMSRTEKLYRWAKTLSPQKRHDLVSRGAIPEEVNRRIVLEQKAKIEKGTEYREWIKKEKEKDLEYLQSLGGGVAATEEGGYKVLTKKEFVERMLRGKGKAGLIAGTAIGAELLAPDKNAEASFIGALSNISQKGVISKAFKTALERAAKGLPVARDSETRRLTGWFKGPDKEWRYAISDKYAKLAPSVKDGSILQNPKCYSEGIKLKDFYHHPKLFKAYPQLQDMKVEFDMSRPATEASYDHLRGAISIGIDLGDGSYGLPPAPALKSVLAHELQHAIQDIEFFARGGSPTHEFTLALQEARKALKIKHEGILPTEEGLKVHDYLRKKYGQFDSMSLYKRLLGEVEARDVASTIDLSEKELRKYIPYSTQLSGFTLIERDTGKIVGDFASAEAVNRFRAKNPDKTYIATPTNKGITELDLIIRSQSEWARGSARKSGFIPATEKEAKTTAEKLGITYNGVQEGLKGPAFHLFTDLQTKSTFATFSAKPDEVASKLSEVRSSWDLGSKVAAGLVGAMTLAPLADFISPRQAEAAGIPEVAGRVVTEITGKILKEAKPTELPKLLKSLKKLRVIPEPQTDPYTLPNPKESIKIIPDIGTIRQRAMELPETVQKTMTPNAVFWHYMGVRDSKELMSNPAVQWACAQTSAIYNSTVGQKTLLRILKDFIPGYRSSAKDLIKSMEPIVEKYYPSMYERAYHIGMKKELDKVIKREWKKVSRKKRFASGEEEGVLAAIEKLENEARIHQKAIEGTENLVREYHDAWNRVVKPMALGKEHSGIRVFLAAEDTPDFDYYPWLKGKLSFEEKAAAAKIKDMMEMYGVRVLEAGGQVFTKRPYMHHAWHPKMKSKEILESLKKTYPGTTASPPMVKIHSRAAGFLPMIPDAEYSVTSYLRDINIRIEARKFWREGESGGWWAFKKQLAENPGIAPKGLLEAFRAFEDGFKPYEKTWVNRWAERIYAFEVGRLLAYGISVPFKHALKVATIARIFGPKEFMKATPKAISSITKIAFKNAKGEQWLKERGFGLDVMDEAIEAVTETGNLYRIISDISPFRVNESIGDRVLESFNKIGAIPLSAVERFDRAMAVILSMKLAAKKGMTPAQAIYSTYDTILKANFLSGSLNPGWLRNPLIRLMLMFQGTPYKIMEQRALMYKRGGEALLATIKQLRQDVIKGEQAFKWEMIKQGLNKEKDLFGTPIIQQCFREIMLIGTAVEAGKWLLDADLFHHFVHVPFVQFGKRDIAISAPPIVNTALETYNQWMQEDYDEFIVSNFFKNWFKATIKGVPAPIPVNFKKALRLSEDDIPERYRDSRLKYLFGVPAARH